MHLPKKVAVTGDPTPQQQQHAEMLVETPVESASVIRGSDVVADK